MEPELMMAECDPKCGFMIRSHDKEEVKVILKEHAKKAHNMDVSDQEAEEKIKPA